MKPVSQFTFLSSASATGAGAELGNGSGEALVFAVSGTFSAEITAQGYLGGAWYDLMVVDLSDGMTASNVTEAGAYTVPCAYGFEKLRLNVTSYTSGSVTAVGRMCRTN